jgi:putative PIN family toxin of toxin-antitoxin system
MTPRIALDTNLLIAALTSPRGASARIVRAWRAGDLEIVASPATLGEAEAVLGAGWLSRIASSDAIAGLLADLRGRSVWVEPDRAISGLDLKDPGDLRMVEAAVAANAQCVVTTDREFLSHRGYADVEFLTPQEFWRRLDRALEA